ncbi:MAG: DUF4198 domain-containing protein [Cyclobacteriaceae bacterium]
MLRVTALLGLYILLSSHELFLKTDSYFLPTNSPSELFLFNGTFDISENTISRDRIVEAKIVGPDFDFIPAENDYYDRQNKTYLRFKSGEKGTYVAGISTYPKMIELDAEAFKAYLEHEGLNHILKTRQEEGISNLSAKEKYSKHVKTIFQVSGSKSGHFNTKFGYPIEFIPLMNPYELEVGNSMRFRLLVQGKPLGNQVVHFSSRDVGMEAEAAEKSTKTDENGEFEITLDMAGKWYVATIHIFKSNEPNIDYESQWATLTFEISKDQ